jgi:hypothetical protein
MIPKEILERTAAHAKPLSYFIQCKKFLRHGGLHATQTPVRPHEPGALDHPPRLKPRLTSKTTDAVPVWGDSTEAGNNRRRVARLRIFVSGLRIGRQWWSSILMPCAQHEDQQRDCRAKACGSQFVSHRLLHPKLAASQTRALMPGTGGIADPAVRLAWERIADCPSHCSVPLNGTVRAETRIYRGPKGQLLSSRRARLRAIDCANPAEQSSDLQGQEPGEQELPLIRREHRSHQKDKSYGSRTPTQKAKSLGAKLPYRQN